MSKIFATLHGVPLTKVEDEYYNRWKYLQKHSRAIVSEAIAMVEAKDEAQRLLACDELYNAVRNYLRLGGKVEDIKHFL